MRFSPRRLFWYATAAAALWAFIGWHGEAEAGGQAGGQASTSNRILRGTQSVVWYPAQTLLTPATFILTGLEGLGSRAALHFSTANRDRESLDSLRRQTRELENETEYQRWQIARLNAYLTQLKALVPRGLSSQDLLQANLVGNITGYNAGPGASLLTLDKGTLDGVHAGLPVMAEMSPIGYVLSAGPKTATVRLLTDPSAEVQAQIVRRNDNGSEEIIVDHCLVTGDGNGMMRCDTIDATRYVIPPARGDMVQLLDAGWPTKVNYMTLGDVEDISRKESQMLRYNLTIAPRVSLGSLRSVMIVLQR